MDWIFQEAECIPGGIKGCKNLTGESAQQKLLNASKCVRRYCGGSDTQVHKGNFQ